jgi:hypothetical protein
LRQASFSPISTASILNACGCQDAGNPRCFDEREQLLISPDDE